MRHASRTGLRLAAIALLGLVALSGWWLLPGRRAEVRLPAVSEQNVPRTAFEVEPIYLQKDPRWADERIGISGEPIRRVGCTVCCLSMALAHYGIAMDPGELNRRLKETRGYTYRGWVVWDAVRRISDGRVQVAFPEEVSSQVIEDALAEGSPVLVKIVLRSGIQHWVLLVGRDGIEYLAKDPLGDGEGLVPLSSLGSEILAVRIVRRVPGGSADAVDY